MVEDPDGPESRPVRRRAAVFAVDSKLLLLVVTEEWHVSKDQFSRVEQDYAAELRCRPDGRKEIRSPAKTVPGIRPFVSRTRRRATAESDHIRLFSVARLLRPSHRV